MNDNASLYVGDDWLLYVDSTAGYKASEMLAPCMLLAQPGHELTVRREDGTTLRAASILHAPRLVSSESSAGHGAAFLYLDPLSVAGHALTHACRDDGLRCWTPPPAPAWNAHWFDALVCGT